MDMKVTYLVKHNRDYTDELTKAKLVAEWAIQNKFQISTKHVKHIGLKSAIANQILRKYGRNKNCNTVTSVKLTITGANGNIQITKDNQIKITCLNELFVPWFDLYKVIKICQIEADNERYYITCEIDEEIPNNPDSYIGVDLNSTNHFAVISSGNKIIKRGKKIRHTKEAAVAHRARLQRKKHHKQIKRNKNKERRRVKDQLHKITRELVDLAKKTDKGIRIENLKGIRKRTTKKYKTKSNRTTNNWNYGMFRSMLEYKAKICGVVVEAINPFNTSKTCSRCGEIGDRQNKKFECLDCGHRDHADSNAAFNIALGSLITPASKAPSSDGCCESATSALSVKAGQLEAVAL